MHEGPDLSFITSEELIGELMRRSDTFLIILSVNSVDESKGPFMQWEWSGELVSVLGHMELVKARIINE